MSLRAMWQIMKLGGRMMVDPIGTGEALADEVLDEDDAPLRRAAMAKIEAKKAKADADKK